MNLFCCFNSLYVVVSWSGPSLFYKLLHFFHRCVQLQRLGSFRRCVDLGSRHDFHLVLLAGSIANLEVHFFRLPSRVGVVGFVETYWNLFQLSGRTRWRWRIPQKTPGVELVWRKKLLVLQVERRRLVGRNSPSTPPKGGIVDGQASTGGWKGLLQDTSSQRQVAVKIFSGSESWQITLRKEVKLFQSKLLPFPAYFEYALTAIILKWVGAQAEIAWRKNAHLRLPPRKRPHSRAFHLDGAKKQNWRQAPVSQKQPDGWFEQEKTDNVSTKPKQLLIRWVDHYPKTHQTPRPLILQAHRFRIQVSDP